MVHAGSIVVVYSGIVCISYCMAQREHTQVTSTQHSPYEAYGNEWCSVACTSANLPDFGFLSVCILLTFLGSLFHLLGGKLQHGTHTHIRTQSNTHSLHTHVHTPTPTHPPTHTHTHSTQSNTHSLHTYSHAHTHTSKHASIYAG